VSEGPSAPRLPMPARTWEKSPEPGPPPAPSTLAGPRGVCEGKLGDGARLLGGGDSSVRRTPASASARVCVSALDSTASRRAAATLP